MCFQGEFNKCLSPLSLTLFTTVIKLDHTAKPLNVAIKKRSTEEETIPCTTKRRTQASIRHSIFKHNTVAEAQLADGFMNAFKAQGTVLEIKKSNDDVVSIPLANSQHNINNLASCCYQNVTFKLEVGVPKDKSTEQGKTLGNDYVRTCLEGSKYSSFFKYAQFIEINEEIVDLLNRDWKKN